MKPREEVKWALHRHVEKHGAMQDEIDQYMSFLDEQMDSMILDPTSEKQFLGNTYKWWASFLAADKATMLLDQQSLPVCLVHGVKDGQIPILSADLAAESLAKTHALTYLRLEGYGHDLDTADIQDAACRWLASVLFGQEPSDDRLIAQASPSAAVLLENSQPDISDYVFSRGRDRDRDEDRNGDGGGKGEVRAGVGGSRDSNGNENWSGDVRGSYDFGNGLRAEGSAGGSINKDRDGNARGEVHGRADLSYGF